MSCRIERDNNGAVLEVRASNGSPSLLFKELREKYGDDQALDMFLVSESDAFETYRRVNEGSSKAETTVKQLEKFVRDTNKTTRTLAQEEQEQVRNLQLVYPDIKRKLNTIFYNSEGVFEIKPEKMREIYSLSEINSILTSTQAQLKIKEGIEALNNTPPIYTEYTLDPSEVEWSSTESLFGIRMVMNPHKIRQDVLEDVVNLEADLVSDALAEMPYRNPQVTAEEVNRDYAPADIYVEVNGEIRLPNMSDRLMSSIDIDKASDKFMRVISTVADASVETLESKIDVTVEAVEVIKTEAADIGLDLSNLENVSIPQLKMLSEGIRQVIENPSESSARLLAAAYEDAFPESVKTSTAVKQPRNRRYVKLDTELSDVKVYEQTGLLRKEDNIFIKTSKKSLEQLYDIAKQHDSSINEVDNKRRAIQEFPGDNLQQAEAVLLLRTIFNVSGRRRLAKELNPEVLNHKDLLENFIPEFSSKMAKEALNKTPLYDMFYSNFYIDEQGGISLKYSDDITLGIIDRLADDRLRQYSLLDRNFPTLTQTTAEDPTVLNTLQRRREEAVSNPDQVPTSNQDIVTIDSDTIIVRQTAESFIKTTDGQVWENVRQTESDAVFKRIEMPVNKRFFTDNVVAPSSFKERVNVNNKPSEVTIRQNKEVKENNFNCR